MRLFFAIFTIFLLFSCENSPIEEAGFAGTWTASWKRCEGFHNADVTSIVLNITDSTENVGTLSELSAADTIHTFNFRFGFNEEKEFWIDSIYEAGSGALWLGTHALDEVQSGSFLLTRPSPQCDNEQYYFVKQ